MIHLHALTNLSLNNVCSLPMTVGPNTQYKVLINMYKNIVITIYENNYIKENIYTEHAVLICTEYNSW